MSEHRASIAWRRQTPGFGYDEYNRAHEVSYDAGITVPASASPEFRGEAERVDPEETFVAALSSCHMLTFLAIAARKRFVVDSYTDEAVGVMTKNDRGKLWVSKVTLRPRIVFGGDKQPTAEEVEHMHHSAHENCFIALSVKTDITIE
ncbi:MAG: OsmC family peroxiredoxin [Alphaproteobacteria bacterium]|nr:OsmC family peroxiredoxin [Alphaproteobacteria bacterium]